MSKTLALRFRLKYADLRSSFGPNKRLKEFKTSFVELFEDSAAFVLTSFTSGSLLAFEIVKTPSSRSLPLI